MYDDVLIPVDESTTDTVVLYHAAEVANYTGADVTLLHVADTGRDSVTVLPVGDDGPDGSALAGGEVVDSLEREGETLLEEATDVLESLGVDAITDVVQGDPAPTIVDYADRYGHDLVIMPTHGRGGLSRYILGSVTEKVVRLSPVPVLTARMDESDELVFPYERILVPVDGSEQAERAAEHAIDLADALDAALDVVSVVETAPLGPDVRSPTLDLAESALTEAVDDVADRARDRGIADVGTHVDRGNPAETILEYAEANEADAIAMGTSGRRGVERILLGSVVDKILRSAPVPVLTVGDHGESRA